MWRQVHEPTWDIGSLAGLAIAVIAAFVFSQQFDPARIAHADQGALLSTPSDDLGHAATHVLTSGDSAPVLLVVGASSMREAFANEADVSRSIASKKGSRTRFVSLATSGQTLVESAQLVASYALPAKSIVLVQVEADRLRIPDGGHKALQDQERIPFLDSRSLFAHRAWVASWVRGRLNPELWRCASALKRGQSLNGCANEMTARSWITASPVYRAHFYPDSALSPATKDSLAHLSWAWSALRDSSSMERGMTLLSAVARKIADNGSRLVLVRLPADSRVSRAEQDDELEFVQAIGELQAAGAPFLDLRKSLALPDSAFYDLHHARAFARPHILESILGKLE